jgi:phosphoribosyl 1,2-cyclic phosphodiesterase
VQTSDQEVLILDAGTGIRLLGQDLARRCPGRISAVLLLSHTHWDHIQGFPFFSPARQRQNRLLILGERQADGQLVQVLISQMSAAVFPLPLEDLDADLLVQEVHDGEPIAMGEQTEVLPMRLPHPGGVIGFRISCQGKVAVYATDVNHPLDRLDARVVDLAQDADLLIHDAQFTPEEKREHSDWGHSSWTEAIQVARQANVQRLALYHHDPMRTDEQLAEIERKAQSLFPTAFVAREGMEIQL